MAQLVETLRYKQAGRGFDFRWEYWNFSLAVPRVDSACNVNEYQEYFLGCKGGLCVGLATCHIQVPFV